MENQIYQANENVHQEEGGKAKLFYKGRYGYQFACSAIEKFGFERLEDERDTRWSLWMLPSKYLKPNKSQIRKMQRWQKFGRFPGATSMTKKDELWNNLQVMVQNCGSPQSFDFLPQTFVLPRRWHAFRHECKKERAQAVQQKNANNNNEERGATGPWIVKPTDKGCGFGIFLINKVSDLKKVNAVVLSAKRQNVVVSRYIPNPLLIDGFKFDLRFFVLVTSFSPLRIFFYNEGLGRFCTEKYHAPTATTLSTLSHLTNTSLNCKSASFHISEDPVIQDQGHLWSWTAVSTLLASHGIDVEALMKRIYDLTIKTIVSAQGKVLQSMQEYAVPNKDNCFQLFGIDVLIDDMLKPWLMEVNGNPCLEPFCSMEIPIKAKLIGDMLRVLGFVSNKKPKTFSSSVPLNPGEQEEVMKAVLEYRNRGDFKMIFPSFKSQEYDQYLQLAAQHKRSPVPPNLGMDVDRCLVVNQIVMEYISEHHTAHKAKKRAQKREERKGKGLAHQQLDSYSATGDASGLCNF